MAISEKFDALVPTSMDQLITLSDRVAKSTLIPREYQGKPADCLLAMSMGMEIGLKPIQALQSIAVINNRPCLWGTAARALIMADPRLASLFETEPGEVEKTGHARCEIMRKGHADPFVGEFTIENARKAQLMGKDNYSKYPGQMLTWRAFHMAAKKAFPDIYKGLAPAEEMQEAEPFNRVVKDDAVLTLELDSPALSVSAAPRVLRDGIGEMVTQTELDESKREFPDEHSPTSPDGLKKRRRLPTPRGPQAQAQPVQESPPPAPAPEACGFCHQTGHDFNSCPKNQSAADSIPRDAMPEPNGQSEKGVPAGATPDAGLTEKDILDLMAIAKTLRPKTSMIFMMDVLDKMGYHDLTEVPAAQLGEVIKRMQLNA